MITVEGDEILMERDGAWEEFEIRGVNMGVGIPGEWATDYAIDHDTYMRWFEYIQELGANTVRVYTIQADDFYNAFYDYNTARVSADEEPLWLIHGVWVNDYVQFSHRDAYDPDFMQTLIDDSKTLVDIRHGNRNLSLGYGLGSGSLPPGTFLRLGDRLYTRRGVGGRHRRLHRQQVPGAQQLPG